VPTFTLSTIPKGVTVQITRPDTFIWRDGVRIARRGHSDTNQGRPWVSLEPGWVVSDVARNKISIQYVAPTLQ
jgi:hypothetical protein